VAANSGFEAKSNCGNSWSHLLFVAWPKGICSLNNRRILVSRGAVIAVAVAAIVCAFMAWTASKSLRRAYMSQVAVMISVGSGNDAMSLLANQLGGVASLLGVGSAGSTGMNEALAILRSRRLAATFLADGDRLANVAALMDSKRIRALDESDRAHVVAEYFQDNVLNVAYDTRSALATVSVTWIDREVAAQWANDYISTANEVMRNIELAEVRRRLVFLNSAVSSAETVGLRETIFRVIEAQIRSEMLAKSKPDFAFRVADPAVPSQPDRYVRPKSWLLAIAGAAVGGIIAVLVVSVFGRYKDMRRSM
jgi:uncharacterized protein involved in exopolysaccharide biosynthesis